MSSEPLFTPADGEAQNPYYPEHPLSWAQMYLDYVMQHFYNFRGWYTGEKRLTYEEWVDLNIPEEEEYGEEIHGNPVLSVDGEEDRQ